MKILPNLSSGKNLFSAFRLYEKAFISVIVVLTVITLTLISLHYIDLSFSIHPPSIHIQWIPDNSIVGEAVRTFGQIIVGAGVLVTFVVNIANIRIKYNSDLIENSYKIIDKWDSEPITTARKFTRELRENRNLNLTEVNSLILEGKVPFDENNKPKIDLKSNLWKDLDPAFSSEADDFNPLRKQEFRRQLLIMFNFWIGIALSIKKKRIDEELVLDALGFKFLEMFDRFNTNFLTNEYEEKGNPNYEILHSLYSKWERILNERQQEYRKKRKSTHAKKNRKLQNRSKLLTPK